MIEQIRRHAAVLSADKQLIGRATSLHVLPEPPVEFTNTYIAVWRHGMGNEAYVPADVIATVENDGNTVCLTIDDTTFLRKRYDHAPRPIAYGDSTVRPLAPAQFTLGGTPLTLNGV